MPFSSVHPKPLQFGVAPFPPSGAVLSVPASGETSPYCLTVDYVRLLEEAVEIHGGADFPIGRAVAEKMGQMKLCEEIPEGYVTLGSVVAFRVDGRAPINRVLVHWDEFCVPGLHLSLHTPWGITLLGMRVGHEAAVYWRGGVAEMIKVESIFRPREHRISPNAKGAPREGSGQSEPMRLPDTRDNGISAGLFAG